MVTGTEAQCCDAGEGGSEGFADRWAVFRYSTALADPDAFQPLHPVPQMQFKQLQIQEFGSARETWEKRSYKRMIVYETDARTHVKVKKFLLSVMEPTCSLRMAEHSFHAVDSMYRKDLFTGNMGKSKPAAAAKQ